jgi:hypothetical protein
MFLGNCHYGQLIETGVEFFIKLGKYIRSSYISQLKFLPSEYNPELVHFRSTQTLRTIHSSMSFIRGLYPGNDTISIEIADKNVDPWRRSSRLCPKFPELFDKLQEGQEFHALENQTFQDAFAKLMNVKWSSTNDVSTSARCNGKDLPPGSDNKTIDEAIKLKATLVQYLYHHKDIFPKAFGFASVEIVNEMTKRITGKSRKRFVHFSTHDGNILGFLGYIGYSDGLWPPYGSFVIVELFKRRSDKNFFLQFKFNGKLIPLSRFNNKTEIPFDEYVQFVRKHLPDLQTECDFDQKRFAQKETFTSDIV